MTCADFSNTNINNGNAIFGDEPLIYDAKTAELEGMSQKIIDAEKSDLFDVLDRVGARWVATALAFDFTNGFHDTANAVATVIYTHSHADHFGGDFGRVQRAQRTPDRRGRGDQTLGAVGLLAGYQLVLDLLVLRVEADAAPTEAETMFLLDIAENAELVRGVVGWTDFDACAALGLDAFVGKLHLTPRPGQAAPHFGGDGANGVGVGTGGGGRIDHLSYIVRFEARGSQSGVEVGEMERAGRGRGGSCPV